MTQSANVKAGGVWRKATHLYVKSGGAWHDCKAAWVKSGGSWRQFFSAMFSVVAGSSGFYVGYLPFIPIGSLSPVGADINGAPVYQVTDFNSGGGTFTVVLLGVYAIGFFTSITVNGSTFNTASCICVNDGTYTTYQWNGSVSGMSSGNTYTVTHT